MGCVASICWKLIGASRVVGRAMQVEPTDGEQAASGSLAPFRWEGRRRMETVAARFGASSWPTAAVAQSNAMNCQYAERLAPNSSRSTAGRAIGAKSNRQIACCLLAAGSASVAVRR